MSRGRTQISESVARMEQVKTETWNGLTQVMAACQEAAFSQDVFERLSGQNDKI